MIRRLMNKLFNLPPGSKKVLGNIMVYLGGIQFLVVMVFAYSNNAVQLSKLDGTAAGWPTALVFALVCLSSLTIIILGVVGFFLIRSSHAE